MTERSMVKAMCEVRLKDKKERMDLMVMLGLNETIDDLSMAIQCSLVWLCLEGRMVMFSEGY